MSDSIKVCTEGYLHNTWNRCLLSLVNGICRCSGEGGQWLCRCQCHIPVFWEVGELKTLDNVLFSGLLLNRMSVCACACALLCLDVKRVGVSLPVLPHPKPPPQGICVCSGWLSVGSEKLGLGDFFWIKGGGTCHSSYNINRPIPAVQLAESDWKDLTQRAAGHPSKVINRIYTCKVAYIRGLTVITFSPSPHVSVILLSASHRRLLHTGSLMHLSRWVKTQLDPGARQMPERWVVENFPEVMWLLQNYIPAVLSWLSNGVTLSWIIKVARVLEVSQRMPQMVTSRSCLKSSHFKNEICLIQLNNLQIQSICWILS